MHTYISKCQKFTNKRFSKMLCLEYHYCLITSIIISIIIVVIFNNSMITVIITIIIIIIIIIMLSLILSSLSEISYLKYHVEYSGNNFISNLYLQKSIYQSDPESYGNLKSYDQK